MLLNIGCGATAHPDWLNLDMVPQHPLAVACDLRHGLPLAANAADACYSSHVLEHLTRAEADPFIAEQFRVLRPNGVIRVVVPDLEVMCRDYLDHLAALRAGATQRDFAYRFTLLEIFDQVVRDRSGGELIGVYRAARGADVAHIRRRHGAEAEPFLSGAKAAGDVPTARVRPAWARRLRRLRQRIASHMLGIIGGAEMRQALATGLFRQSGEVHRVMYDEHAVAELLQRHGFADIRVVGPCESRIPGFASFALDAPAADAPARKPDSLYVEAIKAAA